ncbi:MAG: formylglycine-generating enzyme family protein [Bacteroidia bacterium]
MNNTQTVEKITLTSLPQAPFTMIKVEGGTFDMGSNERENEKPIHKVRLDDFWMAEFQVTQRLWQAVMGNNPSRFKGEMQPVENVSWDDICTDTENYECFLTKINRIFAEELQQNGLPYLQFRLPSEVQWEYAARGGKLGNELGHNKCRYAGSNLLEEVAWYDKNSNGGTMPVGMKMPNALGLYDLSGNVWEWCRDFYAEKYYEYCNKFLTKNEICVNPILESENISNLEISDYSVLRGGSWDNFARDNYRVANRDRLNSDNRINLTGCRLVLFV